MIQRSKIQKQNSAITWVYELFDMASINAFYKSLREKQQQREEQQEKDKKYE